jgi:hypothetical protein
MHSEPKRPGKVGLLRAIMGAAVFGGMCGGLLGTDSVDAIMALPLAAAGALTGGVGGTLVGAGLVFVLRPPWQETACRIAAFLAGLACALAVMYFGVPALMAFLRIPMQRDLQNRILMNQPSYRSSWQGILPL